MNFFRLYPLVLMLGLLAGCGDKSPENRPMPSLPVTVLELHERDFVLEHTLTGSISLYREEKIGFEVSGRVLGVLDEGLEVRGPVFNERGELLRDGDLIASMENTRYRSQTQALQARLRAASRNLDAARAQVKLARQTLKRQQRILGEGAGAQQAVDDAQSAFDQSSARLLARRATVNDVKEQLDRASEDFKDTKLLAPFSGRITAVHIAAGAVVEAGTPVVTLTLMDPVQVRVEVSADDERNIKTGDRAIIYPKSPLHGGERVPVNAIVFEKSAVADPKLRTFRIDLIVRNKRFRVEQLDPKLEGLPTVTEYLPVVKEYQGENGPLFVQTDSLFQDKNKSYVFRLPGVSFHSGAERGAFGKNVPEKVEVTVGEQYITVIKWNFRSIIDRGDLIEGDFLIINPKPEHLKGVAIGRPQWLLRPRDLVPVQFGLPTVPKGFYVPINAITLINGDHAVFTVEKGSAKLRPVKVLETFDELRRIEGNGISTSTRIIVGGVHYVSDDQPVTVTESLNAP